MLQEAKGLTVKRSHLYELVASALGARSYAALMSYGLLCPLPSTPLLRRYGEIEINRTVSRATDLGIRDEDTETIAAQVCGALQEKKIGLVPLDDILTALWTGSTALYEKEIHVDAVEDMDDSVWGHASHESDVKPLKIDNPWVTDGLRAAAQRGDANAHLALALLADLSQREDEDWEEDDGNDLDGRYWYDRRKSGATLVGVEIEWADAYEARVSNSMLDQQQDKVVRQHLERSAALGQHEALLLLAEKYGDQRFFDLTNPKVRADPLWVADLAETLGRYECAPSWVTLAAEQGSTQAMRHLIEQHDRNDPLKCWTWFYLAELHGTDLSKDNYRAIDEQGNDYDDDVGGNLFVDGEAGVLLPISDESVRIQARVGALDLFGRNSRPKVEATKGN